MLFTIKKNFLLLIIVAIAIISCNANDGIVPTPTLKTVINLNHFNYLYEDISFQGKEVGIVHIYSEYPTYEYAIEPNEGFTCVDDIARAIVMLSKHIEVFGTNENIINQILKLTEFVLQMQNENGYFNNFIWSDLSINTSYKTSIAELNWWSLRALWALEYAYPLVKSDAELTSRIGLAVDRVLTNIKRDLPIDNLQTEYLGNLELPTWLPQKYASDQAALLILGLLKNYQRTNDAVVKNLIDAMAKGIIITQKGDEYNYPYGAFMSWENLWHAWGNTQSYALLKAGRKFDNIEYIESALKEVDNYYPKILSNGYAEAFWLTKDEDNYSEIKRSRFPQITYGLRPMVWASLEAYQYSNNTKHLDLAKNLKSWLSGNNEANKAIYNPSTGICFDGIVGPGEVNRNSGAESTIEGLLILLEMEGFEY